MVTSHPHANLLVAKLESIVALTDEERRALADLPMQVQGLRAKQDIVREGDRPSRSCLMLEGFACTFKVTAEGKRQIMAFHIAGDIPDLQSLHLKVLDNSVATIGPCRVGFITHEALRELCERHPRIRDALWRQTLVDAAIFREWMTGLGRRGAVSRLCHLLCEMLERLRAVGLVDGDACPFPVSQTELGDALGLSNVHVNRTLQEIRAAGLIGLRDDTLKVLDWPGLARTGDFDPAYLHLKDRRLPA
jgi:CRP-like cAMP-binding protein